MTATLAQFDLPPMPPLDQDVIQAYADATANLAARVHESDEPVRRAFTYVQQRVLVEAAASIEASLPGSEPPLLPVRRRFIPPTHIARRDGVGIALRYINERLAMMRLGLVDRVIDTETPTVLHAFVEATDPHGKHTNAGMVRVTSNRFVNGDIPFVPPPAEHCRRLLHDAVELAITAPAPALTRATWLLATVFAVHPFVDGNGRTGRLLMHAILSEQSPLHIDWGTIPEFAADRQSYLEATRRPLRPSLPDYDARKMEPIHLMSWVADRAVAGVHRVLSRFDHVDQVMAELRDGSDDTVALVLFGVGADHNARLSELAELVHEPELTRIVNSLVDAGVLAWTRYGYLDLAERIHAST